MADELGMEELSEHFSEEVLNAAHESIYEVLSERAKNLEDYLRSTTPVKSGELVGSLVRVLVENSDIKVTLRVKFDGYNKSHQPYQLIANALNKGYFLPDGTYVTKHQNFIDKGIHQYLSNMDSEIAERFEVKIGGTTRV